MPKHRMAAMDVIGWGLREELADGGVYSLGKTEEIQSFHEFLAQDGNISVGPDAVQDIQVSGICSARLAHTPILYNAVLHLPMHILTEDPERQVVIRVIHDPFLKLYDRELFAVDVDYMARGYMRSHVLDPNQGIFSVRISRAPQERLEAYTDEYLTDQDDLKRRLDRRGWLSLNDLIAVSFWKDGNGVGGITPEYVGAILNHHYKRELTDKLGEKVCSSATGMLYGPAAVAAEMNKSRKESRRRN